MIDVIERIKQSVKEHSYHIVHGINSHDEGMTVQGFYQVIDEELAKEPHKCNSDLISKKKLIEDLNRINSEYYPSAQVSRLMECVNNQPQILVQDSPKLVQELAQDVPDINVGDCISRKKEV